MDGKYQNGHLTDGSSLRLDDWTDGAGHGNVLVTSQSISARFRSFPLSWARPSLSEETDPLRLGLADIFRCDDHHPSSVGNKEAAK